MSGEILQHSTLIQLRDDEKVRNRTSDSAHFCQWALEYYKNKLIDRDKLLLMIKKRREQVDEELFFLDMVLGAKV